MFNTIFLTPIPVETMAQARNKDILELSPFINLLHQVSPLADLGLVTSF